MWHLSSARSISQAALALVNCCCSSPAPRRSSRSSVHSSFRVTFMSASVLMHSLGCRGPEVSKGCHFGAPALHAATPTLQM